MSIKAYLKKYSFLEFSARALRSLIPYEYRKLGSEFWRFYNFLSESEESSLENVQNYQLEKLKKIVEQAYSHSEFYKKKFDLYGFHPDQLKSLDDLSKIPTLTRDEVRQFSSDMVLKTYDKKNLFMRPTSGTTGKALTLFHDKYAEAREWASICYQWKRIGYAPGDGRVEFRGFIDREVDYIYMPDERVLRINLAKLSEENIENVLRKIKKVNYQFCHGYPSGILKFARVLKKAKINFNPRAVMMASEVLYDWQLKEISDVFSCPKFIHYGMAEKVALGAWDQDEKYHFIPAYGVVEYDQSNNELIGTSLINEAMPLIRYRLTDEIVGFSAKPSGKKILYPVIDKINGRDADMTYNSSGTLVPPAAVTFPFNYLKYIDSAKIVQFAIGKVELICETKYSESFQPLQDEIDKVLVNLKKLYGEETEFKVTLTKKIPLSASGKYRWIECRIND